MTEDTTDFASEPMDGPDPFDAELHAMFDAATPEVDEEFADRVTGALGKPGRSRLLALGGAGATGSALAASQLENLVSGPMSQLSGVAGQVVTTFGPEAIVSAVFAVFALGIAWVIPKGNLAL